MRLGDKMEDEIHKDIKAFHISPHATPKEVFELAKVVGEALLRMSYEPGGKFSPYLAFVKTHRFTIDLLSVVGENCAKVVEIRSKEKDDKGAKDA